ncbi:MAG: hypothetical protein CBC13_05285 [Planctomycetia bacterium TMED53]|nr:MAG: hypothetical protein CBC13_05285 [Planctomycetia bacterium TMED53]
MSRIVEHCEESRGIPALLVIVSALLLGIICIWVNPSEVVADNSLDDPAVLKFLEGRYREAISAYRDGQFEKAWKISEAILILAPTNFHQFDQVNALRRRAHGRYLSQSTVAVRFSIADEPGGEGEEAALNDGPSDDSTDSNRGPDFPRAFLTGIVLLENLSDKPIQFGTGATEEDILGQVVWSVKDVYLDGTERVMSDTRVIRLEGGFRVEPGESRGIPVQLPLPISRSRPVLQDWIVTGSTRPLKISTPEGEVTRGLPWIEERGRFAAPELTPSSLPPNEALRWAAANGDVAELVLARHRWLERRREVQAGPDLTDPLIDEIVSRLGTHEGKLDHLLVGILEEITGLVRERSARAWKIWGLSRDVRRGSGKGE